jgi:diguanylate cyclase (GGDEF)-like protein
MDSARRDLVTDVAAAGTFVAAASALWLAGGAPAPGLTGIWLTLLCALLARVEFRVGSGHVAPVMLAIIPMFVLVPAPVLPLLICAAQCVGRIPGAWRRGVRGHRLLIPLTDTYYALAPALALTLLPDATTHAAEALQTAGAFVLIVGTDLIFWPAILWLGAGAYPLDEVRKTPWVYTLDALLVPLGFAIAMAAREFPLAPAAILPLAGLLAFFARERRLRDEQAATLQTILQHASDLILIAGRDGRLRKIMGSAEALLGDGHHGATLLDHVHPDDVPAVREFLARAPGEAEFRLRHNDRHVHAVAADLTGDPHVRALVVTVRDDEVRHALRHRALHDPLTGLANRALLQERIAAAEGEVTIVYLDLNGFKPINDKLGHAAGDEVLRIVARRLEHCVRAGDTVARLGGDEFALLVRSEEAVPRVRAAFDDPFVIGGYPHPVGASIGIATGPPHAETLLAQADAAMYRVKRASKRP